MLLACLPRCSEHSAVSQSWWSMGEGGAYDPVLAQGALF